MYKPEDFNEKIKALAMQTLSPGICDLIIQNYKKYHTLYSDKQPQAYYQMRLEFLQQWASSEGFKLLVQAVHLVQKKLEQNHGLKSKNPHVLNLLGIIFEQKSACENFYTLILLEQMKAYPDDASQEQIQKFQIHASQCKAFFLQADGVESINIGAEKRKEVLAAFSDPQCSPLSCKNAINCVDDELSLTILGFTMSDTMLELFNPKEKSKEHQEGRQSVSGATARFSISDLYTIVRRSSSVSTNSNLSSSSSQQSLSDESVGSTSTKSWSLFPKSNSYHSLGDDDENNNSNHRVRKSVTMSFSSSENH